MVTNINNLGGNNQVKHKPVNNAEVKQQPSGSEQTKQVRQDSVSLTPQAKQLNDIQKKASDAPGIDQKKIDQLKKAISSGEYKINPEKLAANIASFEFELL
jgi:negative regulator of flagellin synthesis FlgM